MLNVRADKKGLHTWFIELDIVWVIIIFTSTVAVAVLTAGGRGLDVSLPHKEHEENGEESPDGEDSQDVASLQGGGGYQ